LVARWRQLGPTPIMPSVLEVKNAEDFKTSNGHNRTSLKHFLLLRSVTSKKHGLDNCES